MALIMIDIRGALRSGLYAIRSIPAPIRVVTTKVTMIAIGQGRLAREKIMK